MEDFKANSGELFIIATPIGNLEDITLRALRLLQSVEAIYCEDTRHSRKLCERHHIKTPLLAYHEHNGEKVRPQILERLEKGQKLALISDAGTPLISDPGYKLVAQARERGLHVTPIPGACAAITALCAAGLPSDHFTFYGFLPPKQQARRTALSAVKNQNSTLIFYESPKRLAAMIADASHALGETRQAVVARELTKQFEEFKRGTLAELEAYYADQPNVKGEIVVMIEGATDANTTAKSPAEIEAMLANALKDFPLKEAANHVAALSGYSKRECYQMALQLKNA